MRHTEEWDWPPPVRRRRFYRTIDYRPSGWNSPVVKKIARIYWQTMVFIVKMLLAVPLSLMILGSIWMLWTIVMLRFN
jgi:hypothetical protein